MGTRLLDVLGESNDYFETLGRLFSFCRESYMSIQGQRVVVTGASSGIGIVTARELARAGGHVVLACRSEEKTRPILHELQSQFGPDAASFLALDLSSFTSVRRATQRLLSDGVPIRLLVNNAGIAATRGLTEDGFELTFGTNHLGHFLFTLPLLPLMQEAGSSRVVTVSSRAHRDAKKLDFNVLRDSTPTFVGLREYAVSKLANLLFASELARRVDAYGITSVSLHPGVVATDVWRRIPEPFATLTKLVMISEEDGAKTTLHCCLAEDVPAHNGAYYNKSRVETPSKLGRDAQLARELWERSETWTDLRFEDLRFR